MLHIGWGNLKKKGVALLTLPGDIGPLFRPQGAGADILTKYILSLHWKRLGRGTLQMK